MIVIILIMIYKNTQILFIMFSLLSLFSFIRLLFISFIIWLSSSSTTFTVIYVLSIIFIPFQVEILIFLRNKGQVVACRIYLESKHDTSSNQFFCFGVACNAS